MFLLIEKDHNKTSRSSNWLLENMAVPYICLYITKYHASQTRIANTGNKPNMKVIVKIPWKLVSLSLSLLEWKDRYCKVSRKQRSITEKFKLNFTRSSALAYKGFVSSSPSCFQPCLCQVFCMLQEVKGEMVLSETAYHFSNGTTDTLGCILGA